MADPRSLNISQLNEFGLPRHGDGVGPTLRPDLIAERHRHDWDRPAAEPLALAASPEGVIDDAGLCAQVLADDLLHRARSRSLTPSSADFLDTAEPASQGGDNELQGARRTHAQAQGAQENPGEA